ncbi:MAG: hypothetical protein ABF675_06235 [Zymomonas mobilis]|uniref:hypothetical protein n=1 Tax=Zymomonas mobilis TaxID=542 RepID=UPI0039E90FA2
MLKNILRLLVAAIAVSSLTATVVTPALAHHHGGPGGQGGPGGWGGGPRPGGWGGGPGGWDGPRNSHHRGGGWGPGAAFGMGALGLMTGAIIANGSYNRGYYDGGGGYYGGYSGYYGGGYANCNTRMQWDPYIGDYVSMRACY